MGIEQKQRQVCMWWSKALQCSKFRLPLQRRASPRGYREITISLLKEAQVLARHIPRDIKEDIIALMGQ